MTKTRLNTVIYMRQSLKNSFQSQKAIHWTQRMNKKLPWLRKS